MKKLGLAFFSAMFLFACNSSDPVNDNPDPVNPPVEEDPLEVHTVVTNAKAFDSWTYYSIEKGEEVEVADPNNSLDWDIAFHRDNVRLNGGKSGKGEGAAKSLEEGELSKVEEAPADGYVKDEDGQIVISYTTGNPKMGTASFNQELKWIHVGVGAGGPVYNLFTKKVFVIKTAKGKYAKLKFLSYLDGRGYGGHVTWQYAYQKDGTTNLK